MTQPSLTWLLLATCLFCAPLVAGEAKIDSVPVQVSVDARVELFCILCRLAGFEEYNRAAVASYARAVDKQFGPPRDYAVVETLRGLRREKGVGFDAPMSLAVHLKDAVALEGRLPFKPRPPGLDSRWPVDDLPEFLAQVREFAVQTDFAGFFKSQSNLHASVVKQAEGLVRSARLEWFDQFFGARPGAKFKVVVSLLNGPNNYGPSLKVDGQEEMYCVLGVWRTDWSGAPSFNPGMLGTIAHEFCHSYVNPLVYAHVGELQAAGEKLFSRVKGQMQRQAYGNWSTMMHESVVRAAVVRYVHAIDGPKAAELNTADQVKRSFLWVPDLVKLLAEYEAQRAQYPRFELFFPKVIEFFKDYSERSHSGQQTRQGTP